MQGTLNELERLFLGLSDKTRLRLLGLLVSGPLTVGELVEGLGESQPKVSRHLAYLRGCGLVATQREGKHVHYAIAHPANPMCASVLDSVKYQLREISNGVAQHVSDIPLAGRAVEESWGWESDSREPDSRDESSRELEIFLL